MTSDINYIDGVDTSAQTTAEPTEQEQLPVTQEEESPHEESLEPTAAEDNSGGEEEPTEAVDYAKIVEEDIIDLRGSFPELHSLTDITELENPLRYAALRDLGLSPKEAYLATSSRRTVYDNRSHLSGAHPKAVASAPTGGMSREEWQSARELFSGLSDGEIYELYKKATR